MKQFLYAIVSLGMSMAAPAYAIEQFGPDSGQSVARRKILEDSKDGLEHLLGNTQECNSVSIGDQGNLNCSQEYLAGGCGQDELKTREIHQYDLTQAKHIKVAGQNMNLTVDGKKVSYYFQDAASAQQAGRLFRTYQENFQPPVSQAPVLGNKY